jgi:hypothetical protein
MSSCSRGGVRTTQTAGSAGLQRPVHLRTNQLGSRLVELMTVRAVRVRRWYEEFLADPYAFRAEGLTHRHLVYAEIAGLR